MVVQALKTDREWKAKGCKLEYISKDADECKKYNERITRQALIKKQNKLIKKLEKRICVWNKHTSIVPTDAKEKNLKKLKEKLIQEQNKLRFFLESE